MRSVFPTDSDLCIRVMPVMTVPKTIGAASSLISLMKPSPSGFIDDPAFGKKWPTSTPAAIPAITCRYKVLDGRNEFADLMASSP